MIHISDPLIGLYWFAGLLAVGIILTIIAKKIKVPEILLILLLGVFIGNFTSIDIGRVIPVPILIGFSIFTLIMIIFESSSKFKLGEIARISPIATKLSVLFIGFCVIFLTSVVHLLFFYGKFGWKDFLVSLLFATLMGATDPDIILSLINGTKNKLLEVLGFESIINTPLTVIVPLMILEVYQGAIRNNYIIHLLQQVMTGVGTGLVLGLIIFRLSYKKFYISIGPLIIIATALVTYVLAEGINGNGVLAVTTLGIVYGRLNLKDKLSLGKFTTLFTGFLKIIAFILIGLLIKLPNDNDLLMKSLLIFLTYVLIRYLAVRTSFLNNPISFKEKLFMSLNIPKGITVVVVTFILFGYNIDGFNKITPLIYLFILYSIFLGSIVTIFANKFVDLKNGSNVFLRKKNVIK